MRSKLIFIQFLVKFHTVSDEDENSIEHEPVDDDDS